MAWNARGVTLDDVLYERDTVRGVPVRVLKPERRLPPGEQLADPAQEDNDEFISLMTGDDRLSRPVFHKSGDRRNLHEGAQRSQGLNTETEGARRIIGGDERAIRRGVMRDVVQDMVTQDAPYQHVTRSLAEADLHLQNQTEKQKRAYFAEREAENNTRGYNRPLMELSMQGSLNPLNGTGDLNMDSEHAPEQRQRVTKLKLQDIDHVNARGSLDSMGYEKSHSTSRVPVKREDPNTSFDTYDFAGTDHARRHDIQSTHRPFAVQEQGGFRIEQEADGVGPRGIQNTHRPLRHIESNGTRIALDFPQRNVSRDSLQHRKHRFQEMSQHRLQVETGLERGMPAATPHRRASFQEQASHRSTFELDQPSRDRVFASHRPLSHREKARGPQQFFIDGANPRDQDRVYGRILRLQEQGQARLEMDATGGNNQMKERTSVPHRTLQHSEVSRGDLRHEAEGTTPVDQFLVSHRGLRHSEQQTGRIKFDIEGERRNDSGSLAHRRLSHNEGVAHSSSMGRGNIDSFGNRVSILAKPSKLKEASSQRTQIDGEDVYQSREIEQEARPLKSSTSSFVSAVPLAEYMASVPSKEVTSGFNPTASQTSRQHSRMQTQGAMGQAYAAYQNESTQRMGAIDPYKMQTHSRITQLENDQDSAFRIMEEGHQAQANRAQSMQTIFDTFDLKGKQSLSVHDAAYETASEFSGYESGYESEEIF